MRPSRKCKGAKKDELNAKQVKVQIISNKQAALELEYHTQKLLNGIRPDHEQIARLLEQMRKPPENIRDRLLQERIDRRLNIIPDESFQKIIEKLPENQAKILIEERKRAQEKDLANRREQAKAHELFYSR